MYFTVEEEIIFQRFPLGQFMRVCQIQQLDLFLSGQFLPLDHRRRFICEMVYESCNVFINNKYTLRLLIVKGLSALIGSSSHDANTSMKTPFLRLNKVKSINLDPPPHLV